jgi:putative membrane protein
VTGRADLDSRARSHLANERTFLAWLRTGLALIVVGIGAAQFLELDRDLIPGVRIVSDFAAVLIVVGTLTVIVGRARYMQSREQIDTARFRPAGHSITLATALIAVIGVVSIVLVYLMGRS